MEEIALGQHITAGPSTRTPVKRPQSPSGVSQNPARDGEEAPELDEARFHLHFEDSELMKSSFT